MSNHRYGEPTPEEWTALYGDQIGRWLLLRGQVGWTPPPHIDTGIPHHGVYRLSYLGSPNDVVTKVYAHLIQRFGTGVDAQQALSEMLSVSQQSVSRYIRGASAPRLEPQGWANLVLARFGADDQGTS